MISRESPWHRALSTDSATDSPLDTIPNVCSKAIEDVKTAHVQEINSLELEIENMQQANNAIRIPFDEPIRDQRGCDKEGLSKDTGQC